MSELRNSLILGALDRFVSVVTKSAGGSHALSAARQARAWWRALGERHRRVVGGIVLIMAGAVHVALRQWQQAPEGWLWLVVPGVAVSVGAVLLASASPDRAHKAHS